MTNQRSTATGTRARLAAAVAVCTALAFTGCDSNEHAYGAGGSHAEHAPAAEEFERGPHRGRLLRDGDFALEITIFETGVPPQFHLYAYQGDEPLPASEVTASIELSRLDGKVDRFGFRPEGDHLVGDGTVVEPHSFDVTVTASHGGAQHRWQYASYEGRTTIADDVAQAAGLTIETAGPAPIRDTLKLTGRVALNGDRYASVKARFPGEVQSVSVTMGDTVRAGQTLAIVENSESLRTYAVVAPIAGTVLARNTNLGDVAGAEPLFEIADLSVLWLELHAFGESAARMRAGQPVEVQGSAARDPVQTSIARVLPLASASSQTVVARALLPNADQSWRPGMAVSADVTVASRTVPLAVRTAALQRFRDFTVVFAKVGETYEVRMLDLGARDGDRVEVLGGLDPGTPYVVEQSFLVKADIEKSGASHDH
jgi:cobalt-zinc-cadmium efflux system membrane fusion protein